MNNTPAGAIRSEPDLQSLRRFALTAGSLWFLYAVSFIAIEPSQQATGFSITLNADSIDLVSWGLWLASVYGATRYSYFAIATVYPPWKTRYWLESGPILSIPVSETKRLVSIHFPYRQYTLEPSQNSVRLNLGTLSRKTRLLSRIGDIDYTAPIWVNILLYFAFILRLLWKTWLK